MLTNRVHSGIFILKTLNPALSNLILKSLYPRPPLLPRQLRKRRRSFINNRPTHLIRLRTPRLIRWWAVAAQPQRINPPRRVWHVPIRVQPARQFHRVRRQVPPDSRIIVPMAVVVQAALGVEILPLKP